ncbi:MAG: GlsB/YeaQ/YmgE family stress response membrane protein [Patescibacteria group bacterium]|jgi:uncharacterized membrane protein YeaQ/YmgE (transglycosylase-associated protein family)
MITAGSIIAFIVIGLVAGWIASEIMTGSGLGIAGDMIVGIVGALIGGNIFALFGVASIDFWISLLTAAVGSIVLLLLTGLIPKSTITHSR